MPGIHLRIPCYQAWPIVNTSSLGRDGDEAGVTMALWCAYWMAGGPPGGDGGGGGLLQQRLAPIMYSASEDVCAVVKTQSLCVGLSVSLSLSYISSLWVSQCPYHCPIYPLCGSLSVPITVLNILCVTPLSSQPLTKIPCHQHTTGFISLRVRTKPASGPHIHFIHAQCVCPYPPP